MERLMQFRMATFQTTSATSLLSVFLASLKAGRALSLMLTQLESLHAISLQWLVLMSTLGRQLTQLAA